MKNGMSPRATTIVVVLAVMLAAAQDLAAYPNYDGCTDCHGDFDDSTSPQGTQFPSNDKHQMHRATSSMNTECALCHTLPGFGNVSIGSSTGTANNPGLGCSGCHGRDYGGAIGVSGVGLRAHHEANGVNCSTCHEDDPFPLPESIKPPCYGTVDTNVDDPCNTAPGFLENWSVGDTQGQDNDGDNVYDAADPDCAPVPGDCDGDRDVDQADLDQLVTCLLGPGGGGGTGCDCADVDQSGDVDLVDYTEFQRALSGA